MKGVSGHGYESKTSKYTKMADIKRLLAKMEEFFKEMQEIEKIKSNENMVSMLKAVKDIFLKV